MFDQVPVIDPSRWHLVVRWQSGRRSWTYQELLAFDDRVEATLDCTGGFYSTQRWSGALLSRLIPNRLRPLSIHVRSLTRYDRRFSIDEATDC